MTTLRQAAQKFVPVGQRLSARDIVGRLGTGASGRRLVQQLTPESRLFASGELEPNTVRGHFELVVFSDGFWSYRGHVHEDATFGGHNYTALTVLTTPDPDGNAYAFPAQGSVHGTTSIGFRDDDWQHDGWDQRISRNWDQVQASGAHHNLHVSENAWDVVETVLAAAGITAFAIFVGGNAQECHWAIFPHNDGTTGVGVTCGPRERQE